ncbi:CBS domain-containing protein [Enterovirga sp. CN4-39]|uniref:CBS domain-containing protein n=1 Tax=Enterovirga sp. CN4-39 TaxID=3400910 RepID=UPI003C10D17F
MSVEHILAGKGRQVVTIAPDRTLADAVTCLSERRIGAVVVVDGSGTVLGIISERDVVRAVAEAGGEALKAPVSSRMTAKVVTCVPTTSIDEIMGLMTEGKFRHVPVIEGGRLAGIISIGDVVKQRLGDIESEHRAMRDYIATA